MDNIPEPPLHEDSSPNLTSSRNSLTTSTSCSSPSIHTTGESNDIHFVDDDRPTLPDDPNRRFYEVYFTCFVGTYFTSKYTLNEGDFIIVQADRGHDIGVVNRLIEFEVSVINENNEVISVVPKDEFPVRAMLQDKVIAQNQALEICRNKCVELLISTHIEVIATEFQFDRKKLTLYYKKHSDVSVCKLIRKLYNIFKMRIWMEPIDVELCNDSFSNITAKFLSLAQITIPPQEKTTEVLPVPPPTIPKKEVVPLIAVEKPAPTIEVLRRDPTMPQKAINRTPQNSVQPASSQYRKQQAPVAQLPQYHRAGDQYHPQEQYKSREHHNYQEPRGQYQHPAGQYQYQSRDTYHQYQPRDQYYQSRDQYQYQPRSQPRSAAPGYYQKPPSHQHANNYHEYDRNNIRDPSFNYRDQYDYAAPYDYDSYRPHAGSLRQERTDRNSHIAEEPYYQFQQQQPSQNFTKYNDGNFRSPPIPASYQNEDVGRFLTNGLLEEDNVTSSLGETDYEYSNFMSQSSYSSYYQHQG